MHPHIQQLLAYKPFHDYARWIFQQNGRQPPADAAVQYLRWLHANNPQTFANLIGNAPQHIAEHTARGQRLEKLNASGLLQRAAEAWKGLPESHGFRAAANDPTTIRGVAEAMRRAGFAPLPGMNAAETVLAIVNAAEGHEELLAQVAPTIFGGTTSDAQQTVNQLRSAHATATAAHEVGERQRARREAFDKARGIVRQPPPTEPTDERDATRAEVRRQFARRQQPGAPVYNAEHNNTRATVAAAAGYKIKASDRLRKEVVREARELGYSVGAPTQSGHESAPPRPPTAGGPVTTGASNT